jgi:hypothetical protein
LNFETDEGSIAGRVYLSDKAFERSLGVLKECFDFDGNFENLKPLVGQECSITTEFEDDQEGNPRLRVKWINPKGGPKMDPNAKQSLAAKLSAKAGFAGNGGSGEDTVGDDDTPF